jgi:RNA polymerase sigma factor (sigma-70 family)
MRTEDGYIIRKCLNGESEAFGLLVDKYKASIYAFTYAKLRNFHDAEDVTQEVFIKAYKNLRTLKRWDSFLAWLYSIASDLCRKWVRSQIRRPDHTFIKDQGAVILESRSLDSYRENTVYESLHEALDSLPEIYRQVLTLYYLGGMNSHEIARFLGASPTAIRKRLSRARLQLREEMVDMMGETLKQQRLQASFTFRIVEAVKRVKINPAPRLKALPWGISAAASIIFTILSLNPHLSSLDPIGFPKGAPLPALHISTILQNFFPWNLLALLPPPSAERKISLC